MYKLLTYALTSHTAVANFILVRFLSLFFETSSLILQDLIE